MRCLYDKVLTMPGNLLRQLSQKNFKSGTIMFWVKFNDMSKEMTVLNTVGQSGPVKRGLR